MLPNPVSGSRAIEPKGGRSRIVKSNLRQWFQIVLAVLALSLGTTVSAKTQAPEQAAQSVVVNLSVGIVEETASYIITLQNMSSSEIANVYVAGSVPEGAKTLDATSTPRGSWFRGFEAAGTPLHAAVWLIDRIPANSTVGPFIYRVSKGQASDMSAFGWIHWLAPTEGSAISSVAKLASGQLATAMAQGRPSASTSSVLTTVLGGRFHEIHASKQGLQCTTCHTQKADGYDDPMAQVYNPVDKNACLSCHSSNRIFYGDEWQKSAIGR